nr:M15 family metallopeptidase [Agrobacterium tumefaciens]
MFAHCVYRDDVEQQRLYVKGLSKAKPGQSAHNYGLAVDIVHGTKAWDLTRKQWDLIGHIGKEVAASLGIKVEWGGDWSFYDPAHWELANWRDIGPRK